MLASAALAHLILAIHLAVILFNIFGLVAVPIGAAIRWRFVRVRWWRAAHLGCLMLVAVQALLGRACFLTIWQAALEGDGSAPRPLIYAWINRAIYWNLPLWVFAALYVAALIYAVALWRLVPPRRRHKEIKAD
jgi:hypothetical protein